MHERYYVIGDCGSMDLHTVVEGLCEATRQEEVTLTPEFDKATHLLAIGKGEEHSEVIVRFAHAPDMPLLVLDDSIRGSAQHHCERGFGLNRGTRDRPVSGQLKRR